MIIDYLLLLRKAALFQKVDTAVVLVAGGQNRSAFPKSKHGNAAILFVFKGTKVVGQAVVRHVKD